MDFRPSSSAWPRFLAENIRHAVCLYHCFSLTLRDVERIRLNAASRSQRAHATWVSGSCR